MELIDHLVVGGGNLGNQLYKIVLLMTPELQDSAESFPPVIPHHKAHIPTKLNRKILVNTTF
jgi:hypothetical protein